MADDSQELICPPYFNCPSEPPRGTLPYEPGVLTLEQQVQVNVLKVGIARDDQRLLADHPEVSAIVTLILRAVFAAQPRHVHEFVAEFMSRDELREELAALLRLRGCDIESLPSSSESETEEPPSDVSVAPSEKQRVSFFMERPMSGDWTQFNRLSNARESMARQSVQRRTVEIDAQDDVDEKTPSTKTSFSSSRKRTSSHKELRFDAASKNDFKETFERAESLARDLHDDVPGYDGDGETDDGDGKQKLKGGPQESVELDGDHESEGGSLSGDFRRFEFSTEVADNTMTEDDTASDKSGDHVAEGDEDEDDGDGMPEGREADGDNGD